MWATIASGALGAILKAIPWGTVFAMIFKAILTSEAARKHLKDFVANVPDRVPVKKQDEYNELKRELHEKFKSHPKNGDDQ